ncbi:MAG TPA: twin-arginine translocation signal domain-containing protein [Casimicrobiaceae bacterium]
MERRNFLRTCALAGGAIALASRESSLADVAPRYYAKTRLVDIHGDSVRIGALPTDTNFVFHYPYAATPCFLLKLDRAVVPASDLRREDGATYAWQGGVGPGRNLVAFSAICAHTLAYPTRDVSFIRFQKDRSATSSGNVIHCCADHSVYDPTTGARVIAGPAPQPLAAIVLAHDAARDELFALGTIGPEQFDAFFAKYDVRLSLEYGGNRGRAPVTDTAVVRELENYCKTTIRC